MIFLNSYPLFKLDALNSFVAGAIILFSALTLIYSSKFMKGRPNLIFYYAYIILTGIAAVAAVLANNLVLLLIFWGFLGLLLYLLINMGDDQSALAAKKMLVIVGGSDALMILGIGIIYSLIQNLQIDQIKLELNNPLAILSYVCLALGCFAKAGAAPVQTWIPDCAKSAPVPVSAYTIASLDKLLGIYLLARISFNIFLMNNAMNMALMIIGAITIIGAVIMVIIQNNFKKLLGFCAVSQVGYMVLGIGTGNPIGIAGGLFHMLNHSIYEACLFFTGGNLEYRTNTTEFNELGGLAKAMPVTYSSAMVASLSVSGIPPFNGFVSKWMIYQGIIISLIASVGRLELILSVFCLISAMFGSALTLASIMKLMHASFLGQRPEKFKNIKEVSLAMWGPCLLLALMCIIFGVGAFVFPLKLFIFPAVSLYQKIDVAGLSWAWSPMAAGLLLIFGLILGFFIFGATKIKNSLRRDNSFIGGEVIPEDNRLTGDDFYNTVREVPYMRSVYRGAESGKLDIYEQSKKIFSLSAVFRYLHNGVLPTYLVWVLLGAMSLFLVLVR